MRTIPITFAASRQHAGLAARCAAGIVEHWPRADEHPRIRLISPESLLPIIKSHDVEIPDVALDHPLVMYVDDQMPLHEIAQLADALTSRQTPMVFLFRDVSTARTLLSESTAITDRWDIEAKLFAPMLYTLSHRQSAVRQLGSELRLSQHALLGLTAEMERLHYELELAAAVQREFIPRTVPQIDGLDSGVIFRPAGFVSGDIYDVQKMSDTLVAFFLADAVGHGVPAALLTMAITRSLQPRNFDHFDPCTALKKLNDELSRHPSGTHRFATAICGTLDLATSKLTIAGAGHPYPLLIEPSGVRLLETEGPMLGVFEDAEFTEVSVTLTPEQTLLIHSDGLEASLEAHQMNVPTLARAFAEDPDVSVHRCMEQLETLLDGGVGSLHQQDDVTLLALRRAPIAAPLKMAA